jgi:hypothetical protein
MAKMEGDDELANIVFKIWKRVAIGFCLSILVVTLTPSSKTFALMVVLPRLADSQFIQKDAPDIYKLAIDALKKQLQPDAEKK